MDTSSTPLPTKNFQVAAMSGHALCLAGAAWTGNLAKLSQPEGRFASVLWQHAVHDVRGKLGVVTNLTALLQRPLTDARRLALLAMLDRNVASLGQLLDGVAELARLDARPELPVLRRINAAAVLQQVCDSVAALAESRGVGIEFCGPAILLAETDALMLERIAQNLMLNAVRYTRAPGTMLVCGSSDAAGTGRWMFEVRDAAPVAETTPNSPRALAGPSGVQPLPAGEGIGLSIVARLSQTLGGSVQTTFTVKGWVTRITLPVETRLGPVAIPALSADLS